MEEKIDYAGKLAVIPNRKRGFSIIRVEDEVVSILKPGQRKSDKPCEYRRVSVYLFGLLVYRYIQNGVSCW